MVAHRRDHYGWHMDVGPDGDTATRKISVTVQLSDPDTYEGGNLELMPGDVAIMRRVQGGAVLFPSFLLHRVTPMEKGTRYSLVAWFVGTRPLQ